MKPHRLLFLTVSMLVLSLTNCPALATEPERPALTIVYDSFARFIYTSDGEARGLYVDIVNEALEERLQIPVTFEWQPWQRAQYSVKQGERDAMITVATPARLDYAAAGEVPVAVSTVGLFTTSDHSRLKQMEQIRSTDDLRGYRILTYLGDGWALDNLDGLDVDSDGNDLQTVLRKLAWGRGDLFPQTVEVTRHYIEELGYDDAIVQLPGVNLGQIEFRLMISRESGFVDRLADIDAVLSEMWQDGTMERLLKPYQ